MQAENPETDPLHVLVVSNHWSKKNNSSFGGIWADRQINALRSLGLKVSTFDLGTSHSPVWLFRKWLALRKEVKRLRPDLVHARYGTIVATISVFSGCPAIITFAGSDLLRGAGISWLRTTIGILLSNFASLRAKAVICVSEELRRALWWRSAGAMVIPDGVDLNRFAPCPRDDARRKLRWDLQKKIVLIDSARDPICKGLELAQQAIQYVRRQVPGAELRVLDRVSPDQMALYLNAADVVLCASRQEGSPNIVKEALACNVPVVSTPVGDVPERLEGVSASQIVARNPEQMGDVIAKLLLLNCRSNGRAKVQQLGLEKIALKVLQVYLQALGRKNKVIATYGERSMESRSAAMRFELERDIPLAL